MSSVQKRSWTQLTEQVFDYCHKICEAKGRGAFIKYEEIEKITGFGRNDDQLGPVWSAIMGRVKDRMLDSDLGFYLHTQTNEGYIVPSGDDQIVIMNSKRDRTVKRITKRTNKGVSAVRDTDLDEVGQKRRNIVAAQLQHESTVLHNGALTRRSVIANPNVPVHIAPPFASYS